PLAPVEQAPRLVGGRPVAHVVVGEGTGGADSKLTDRAIAAAGVEIPQVRADGVAHAPSLDQGKRRIEAADEVRPRLVVAEAELTHVAAELPHRRDAPLDMLFNLGEPLRVAWMQATEHPCLIQP